MATAARDRLAAHKEQIARLQGECLELQGLAIQEAENEAHVAKVAEWERMKTLSLDHLAAKATVDIVATYPVNAAGVKRWHVGAGTGGQLLAVWEVHEYRGERRTRLAYGDAPWNVRHLVFRVWDLVSI